MSPRSTTNAGYRDQRREPRNTVPYDKPRPQYDYLTVPVRVRVLAPHQAPHITWPRQFIEFQSAPDPEGNEVWINIQELGQTSWRIADVMWFGDDGASPNTGYMTFTR